MTPEPLPPTPASPVEPGYQVIRTDAAGLTVWVNDAFTRHTGWSLADMHGRTPGSVLQPAACNALALRVMAYAVRTGSACRQVELENQRKDGSRFLVRLDIEPERDAQGRLLGFTSVQQRVAAAPDPARDDSWLSTWFAMTRQDRAVGHFMRNLDTGEGRWDEGMFAIWEKPWSEQAPALEEQALLVPEPDRTIAHQRMHLGMSAGSHDSIGYRIVLDGGRIKHVQSDWLVYLDSAGHRIMVGSNRDISTSMRMTQEAALLDQQLLLAADIGNIGLTRENLATGAWSANAAAHRQLGLKDESLRHINPVLPQVHPQDLPQLLQARAQAIAQPGHVTETHFRVLSKDGQLRHVRARRMVTTPHDDEAPTMLAVQIDETEAVMQAERESQLTLAREQSLLRLQALFDNAFNGIVLTDDNARIVDANPAATTLLLRTREQLLTLALSDVLVHGDDTQDMRARWRDFLAQGRDSGLMNLRRPDGTARVVDHLSLARVLPNLHVHVLADATQRLHTETLLRDLAVQQREDFDSYREELARDVHDELGQSLGALSLELGLLQSRTGADMARLNGLLNDAVSATRNLARSLGRSDDDPDLAQSLRNLVEAVTRRTEVDVELAFNAELPPLPPTVARGIYRVVQEALNNAVKHAHTQHVSVELRMIEAAAQQSSRAEPADTADPADPRQAHEGARLQVCISDAGVGFSPEQPSSLDTGMGLMSMRQRVEKMRGRLAISSAPGQGTQVRLWVPLQPAAGSPTNQD